MKVWQVLTATTVVALGLIIVGQPFLATMLFITYLITLL
jgi:hypothetical protein